MKSVGDLLKKFFAPVVAAKREVGISVFFAFFGALYDNGIVMIFEFIARQLQDGDRNGFWYGVVILGSAFVIRFLIRRGYKGFVLLASAKIGVWIDSFCLKKFLRADNNLTESLGSGRIYSLMRRGALTWSMLLFNASWGYARTFFTLIITLIYVGTKGGLFLLLSAGVFVWILFWIYLFVDKANVWRRKAKKINTEMDRMFTRRFSSKFEIVQQDGVDFEITKDKAYTMEWYRLKLKEKYRQGICYDGATLIAEMLVLAVIVLIGIQVFAGTQTFADYVVIIGLSVLISKTVFSLSDIGKEISDQSVHLTKLWELLDSFDEKNIHQGTNDFDYQKGDIAIEDMSYAYVSGRNIFTHFFCVLIGGKKTALVGPSGSGKSTLLRLIAGYLIPDTGTIYTDDQDLSTVLLTSYYRHIGYLTQDPNVFDGTIRENLLYSSDDSMMQKKNFDETVQQALLMAKCEWVYDLPEGLDTEIGERGVRLSGGQRQRLAIAKIFLKDPQIVLLDEPTSALDSFSEEAITEAMQNLFAGRTVIIVAHRLQTVKSADDIIFIDEGQVVERGTHDELIALGGRYAKMLELQSGF